MRLLIILAATAATIMPGAAIAEQRHDRMDVRHERREVRQDRRELRRDRHSAADRRELRRDRRDLRGDQRELRHERRDLRQDRRFARRHRVAYVAPYHGWRYRPVTVGYRLQPAFYGSRYYISDYGAYRLYAPGRWQRWVRYGDDLLLVNVRSGRVLRVIHYRYW